ncbi:OsmC family protein [Sphingomonas sp. BN140010]|uniref:OsmC family protein n=1 Tax=Sphingomonas arvum TaxID=2992113 RepID=A0ABT3JD48_9SPHN|nr:OsmC family protein [Sphingomonas sp. BN140010]MCW3796721.1 OsmC family protein [Sphingomonas sp. BN140010]
MLDTTTTQVNGIDLGMLGEIVDRIQQDPDNGALAFAVTTRWTGGTRSEATVEDIRFGGQRIPRDYLIEADEPTQICGTDQAPNPQELLMAAFNACITVGYVAGAATKGIKLERLEIRTSGTLDLRGFLGLSDQVAPGYESVDYEVTIAGDGTPEQFAEIHQAVMKTSPNYYNLGRPIRLNGTLNIA